MYVLASIECSITAVIIAVMLSLMKLEAVNSENSLYSINRSTSTFKTTTTTNNNQPVAYTHKLQQQAKTKQLHSHDIYYSLVKNITVSDDDDVITGDIDGDYQNPPQTALAASEESDLEDPSSSSSGGSSSGGSSSGGSPSGGSSFLDHGGAVQQNSEILDDSIILETCKLDRGCLRRDRLNQTYLTHCHRYKLEYLFSSDILMSIMHGDSKKCQLILQEFMQLDEVVSQFDRLFNNLLTRYNCHNGYSVKWTCDDCKKAYKDWLCAINLPYYMHGEQVKPCISFCERVEQRCPYLHPITREQYGGQPVFICRDPNIPFVPSITPSIPYSEPTRCYELCHLSDNETELINDSLSKYAYNDCPHRDSIAEEIRSDPLYNRCQWSPAPIDAPASGLPIQPSPPSPQPALPIGDTEIDDGRYMQIDADINNNNHLNNSKQQSDDSLYGDGQLPETTHTTTGFKMTQPPATQQTVSGTSADSLDSNHGQSAQLPVNHHHQQQQQQKQQQVETAGAATATDDADLLSVPHLAGTIAGQHDHNTQHVHNKTLAELRDILHQYKSQPKHRPGAHGSGTHLHHLHNSHDDANNVEFTRHHVH